MTGRRVLRSRGARWVLLGLFVSGLTVGTVWGGGWDRSALLIIALAAYVVVGIVLSSRRPDNPLGWLFLLIGGLTGLSGFADALITQAAHAATPTVWYGVLGAWIEAWFWFPLISIATLFTVLLFPDGLLGRSWRPLLWTSVAATVAQTVAAALAPTLVLSTDDTGPTMANPLYPGWPTSGFGAIEVVLAAALVGCGVGAAIEAVLRARRATGVERAQMRWFTFSAVLALLWVGIVMVIWQQDSILREVFFTAVIGFIPVSCGIAIMRYHLYDIDRVISRTTSYAIVTGLVLTVYLLVVALATRLLPDAGRLPVALATLAAAALVRPVLRRVQDAVDRRFNRSRFDARRTLDAFGDRLQHEVDVMAVSGDLVTVVRTSLAPATVTVWLPSD